MDDRTTGLGKGDDLSAEGEGAERGAQSSAAGGARRARTTRSASGSTTTRSKRGSAMDSPLDPDTTRRTRELETEIAETREDLSETVEAIQEKLRPSNIISEGTDAVKTAATQRAREMADTATEAAYDVVESARRNPWPALMIGTGVAWLLYDTTRNGGSYGSGSYRTGRYQSGRYQSDRYRSSGYRQPEYNTTARASGDYDDEREDWGREHEYSGSSYGQRWNARSVRDTTRRAQTGLQRMLHENPLLVAAAAVLTGAAVGGSLPQTDKENELMGEARDQVVERAQGAAREAADSVRDVANAVQQVAHQVTDTGQQR